MAHGASLPDGPGELSGRSWRDVLKRTLKNFKADNLTDWAAALTYYGVLSIFPALLALVSILGLIGSDAIDPLVDNVASLAPGAVQEVLTSALDQLRGSRGAAGLALVVGLAVALWSASGYVAAFMRASNIVYRVPEGRPVWKTLPVRVGVTLVLVVGLALTAVGITVTGGIARRVGDVFGLGDTAVLVWDIAKWPVLLLLISVMIALLYWASPNVKQPGFRWITPGSLLAVIVWIIASAAFALYVANFGSYNQTYGSIAAVIIFLIWLWLTNTVILLGHKLNAELDRGRAVEAGLPPGHEPFAELRDSRKADTESKERAEETAERTGATGPHRSDRRDRDTDNGTDRDSDTGSSGATAA
ncbi:YihY/virulence factor BrkB family protein [Streptomyces aidingensis]|uniref:Membrane protein n=1 Tax=Streptomyces aidingensis TaxID=910347 RepID=A0A1I1L9D7_9ACTN|nr:YihY/virulence factor BrkB family protein [Streptomyces aidingensis]SFC69717.1 membrane protein [Streptomyces aidingensis]